MKIRVKINYRMTEVDTNVFLPSLSYSITSLNKEPLLNADWYLTEIMADLNLLEPSGSNIFLRDGLMANIKTSEYKNSNAINEDRFHKHVRITGITEIEPYNAFNINSDLLASFEKIDNAENHLILQEYFKDIDMEENRIIFKAVPDHLIPMVAMRILIKVGLLKEEIKFFEYDLAQ